VAERFGDLQAGLSGTDDDERSWHAAQINFVRSETRLWPPRGAPTARQARRRDRVMGVTVY
jgi:hypothetical protein